MLSGSELIMTTGKLVTRKEFGLYGEMVRFQEMRFYDYVKPSRTAHLLNGEGYNIFAIDTDKINEVCWTPSDIWDSTDSDWRVNRHAFAAVSLCETTKSYFNRAEFLAFQHPRVDRCSYCGRSCFPSMKSLMERPFLASDHPRYMCRYRGGWSRYSGGFMFCTVCKQDKTKLRRFLSRESYHKKLKRQQEKEIKLCQQQLRKLQKALKENNVPAIKSLQKELTQARTLPT